MMKIRIQSNIILPMITLVIILLFWEALGRTEIFTRIILPPFSDVMIEGIKNFDDIRPHIIITLYEIFIAFSIAASLGIGLGFLIGLSSTLRGGLIEAFSLLQSIPLVIIYPVLFFALGLGSESKIAFGAIQGFLPIVLNTISGVRSIDRGYYILFYSFKATRKQILTKLVLRGALNGIIAGLRMGLALTMIGVIVAELLASYGGLGHLIGIYQTTFRVELIWFCIIIAMTIVATIVLPMKVIEDKLTKGNSPIINHKI